MPQSGAPTKEERLKKRTQLCVEDLLGNLNDEGEGARHVLMKYNASLQRIAEVSVRPEQERAIVQVQFRIVIR